MPPRATPTGYIPALDGLRGAAVALVIACHLAPFAAAPEGTLGSAAASVFYFGWVGVDLFFVLSGFLITGILFDNRGRAGYFSAFYGRRLVRIFPLYYVTLAVIAGGAVMFASPSSATAYADTLPWHATYLTNVRIALAGAWSSVPFHTGHFWSLAVEEQFYLVWPAIIAFAPRLLGASDARQALLAVCLAVIALSIVIRIALVGQAHPLAAYALFPARMDALAIGGVAALWVRSPHGPAQALRWSGPVLWTCGLGLAAIAIASAGLESYIHPLQQTVGYTLWALLFGALLIRVIYSPRGRMARCFQASPLMATGKISYGLYVVHFPVIYLLTSLGGASWSFLPFAAATIALSFALALLSWQLIERPLLRLKRHFPYGTAPADASSRMPTTRSAQSRRISTHSTGSSISATNSHAVGPNVRLETGNS